MKSKGFTLIELLAVIVILAIVTIIATPIVLDVVNNTKDSAAKSEAATIVSGVNKYCETLNMTQDLTGKNNICIDGVTPDEVKVMINLGNAKVINIAFNGKVTYLKIESNDRIVTYNGSEYFLGDDAPTETTYKCRRATQLHTEICQQEENEYGIYCSELGYTTGSTIAYGNLGTQGSLASGDAFDCDVNGDGTFDAETERFYYVSDLYNTTSKEFDSDYAVLIYYSSTVDGVANNNGRDYNNRLLYNDQINYQGPVNLVNNLPTTNQWGNISLSSNNRAIITDTGATATTGGTLPTSFSYTKEVNGVTVPTAARLLTVQELKNSCNTTIIAEDKIEIIGCNYLMENTHFANPLSETSSLVQGYWLENPLASNDYAAWDFNANVSKLYATFGDIEPANSSVRPVIEVLKTDIDY